MLDLEDEVLDDSLSLARQRGQSAMTNDVDAAVGEQTKRDEVRVPDSRQNRFQRLQTRQLYSSLKRAPGWDGQR